MEYKYEMGNEKPILNVLTDYDNVCSISFDDHLYNYNLLPSKKACSDVSCHINVFKDDILVYFISTGDNIIDCVLFNPSTLDSLKIRFRCNITHHTGSLILRKAYLVLWIYSTTKEQILTYHTVLIKVPNMEYVLLEGYYSVIDTPRFLILVENELKSSLIIDVAGDSIKPYPYELCNSLYEHWRDAYISLIHSNAIYNISYGSIHDTFFSKLYDSYDKINFRYKKYKLYNHNFLNTTAYKEFVKFVINHVEDYSLGWCYNEMLKRIDCNEYVVTKPY